MTITVGGWQQEHADLPRTDRDVLLMDALNVSRATVMSSPERPIDAGALANLNHAAQRLRAGEPLAYVRGFKEFWGHRFSVTPDVLVPRPETEHLVEQALNVLAPHDTLLDLGTGSGAVAISIALERPDVTVTAVDRSWAALQVAQHNAADLGATVQFVSSNWFECVSGSYAVVVSNPPYVASIDPALANLAFEPASALVAGEDGLTDLRHIVSQCHSHCERALLVEHGADQGADVARLFHTANFHQVQTVQDLAGLDRVTLGWRYEH